MTGIRVVTDSACDLSDELLTEHGIGLVPLHIRFGSEELVDRHELPTKQFWMRARAFDGLPATAAPSPGNFRTAFERMADEGADGVVCVNLSSKLSATIEAAKQAGRELEGKLPVRVVDSLSVTLGLGLQVLVAAQAAEEGKGLDSVADAVTEAQGRLQVFGVIDTLENLHRGGRIGGAQAMLGSLLSIKPVIQVRDGEVQEESKQRTRSRSLRYLSDKVHHAGRLERLAVMGADAPDLDTLVSLISDVQSEHPMLVDDIGPVIGSHAGPGAVGVAMLLASG